MIKHIFLLLILSAGMVMGMPYVQHLVELLVTSHEWVSTVLTQVFTVGQAGNIARELIALLAIPVVIGLVPAIIYWMLRRRWMAGFMEIIWVVWLVQAGALAIAYKAVAATTTGG